MLKTAKQDTETRGGGRWAWVEACVWTERMLAALEQGVKGGKWFSLIDKVYTKAALAAAWQRVASKRGAGGIDRVSVERFAAQAEHYLGELAEELKSGSYEPLPVKRVEIPKGDGRMRPLGIPAVRDRVVQSALKSVIEPIFENEFVSGSYGFRPGRSAKDALREVDRLLKAGYAHVVDADIQSYFDTIAHARLMRLVEARISDGRMLDLLRAFLRQQIMSEMVRWTPTQGTAQGAVLSPLLANVYLHELDVMMQREGYRMVRYADDFVVLCETQGQAEQALARVRQFMTENQLSLHPGKTRVGDCRVKGQGFEFLGYRFEAGRRWVRKKSGQAFKQKIRARTRRTRGDAMACIIAELNPMLKGWYGYFQHAYPSTFPELDGFVRRRLRAILCKQQKRHGLGWWARAQQTWPNAFFATLGLFTLTEAHRFASQSRCGNH